MLKPPVSKISVQLVQPMRWIVGVLHRARPRRRLLRRAAIGCMFVKVAPSERLCPFEGGGSVEAEDVRLLVVGQRFQSLALLILRRP
jgi:hypothetical protein